MHGLLFNIKKFFTICKRGKLCPHCSSTKTALQVPTWLSGLRIQYCHCRGSGHCYGVGSISGNFQVPRVQAKKKKKNLPLFMFFDVFKKLLFHFQATKFRKFLSNKKKKKKQTKKKKTLLLSVSVMFFKHLVSNSKPTNAQTIPSLEYTSSSPKTTSSLHIFQLLPRMT